MMEPHSEAELSGLVKGSNGPLRIRGGGTRVFGRPVQGEVVSTANLSAITLYEPGALTLVAKAGTPLSEIERELAKNDQQLAFEPMDHQLLLGVEGTPTIGGAIAANVSGPRRISVGAARDFLLGVRFVDGQGDIIKNGGRVMKNVTGYDLVKLMAGSYGTLGILTEVSLKVMPADETAATIAVAGLGASEAVAALSAALGSPFDVTGAAYEPASGQTAVRIEGFKKSVEYRSDELVKHLKDFGEVNVITGSEHDTLWRDIRDVTPLAGAEGDIWRISVRPSDGPKVIETLKPKSYLMDWGGGLIWAEVDNRTDIRSMLSAFSGHATLIKASPETRAIIPSFHPSVEALEQVAEGLRKKFDPRGILNPGLMN